MINPIPTTIATHNSSRTATAATLAAAQLTLHTTTEEDNTDRADLPLVGGFRIGDVLLISLGGLNGPMVAGAVTTHVVTIESRTETVLSFTPAILSEHIADIDNGDGMSVHVIGRLQEPQSRCSSLAKHINCYSFALKPEEHQPSGTCNFSRIDNAQMIFSAECNVDTIYAVNYNVLRIMSGMGGLAYSN